MRATIGFLTLCMVLTVIPTVTAAAQDDVAQRRNRVLKAVSRGASSVPLLQRALEDDSPLVRRAAVRALVALGAPARAALDADLRNDDIIERRTALLALAGDATPEAMPYVPRAMESEDEYVREIAVRILLAMEPCTPEIIRLLEVAENDPSPRVHRPAVLRLLALDPQSTPFEVVPPERVPLRERPEMADRLDRIEVALQMPLPREGWRFQTDTRMRGHRDGWFAADFDDSGWRDMQIETAWMTGYVGVGWYRRQIDLPPKPEHVAAELVFEGVDENAWVWVNGAYVGGQAIGPSGWNRPFRVDVTEEIRWGEPNQITVRAMNTAAAGGIWRPVRLEALTVR